MKNILFLVIAAMFMLSGMTKAQGIVDFPWTENFNAATFPPDGWTSVQESGEGNWRRITASPAPHDGTGGYAWRTYTSGAQSTFLITPPLSIPAGIFELSFMSYIGDPNYYPEDIGARVMVSTKGIDPDDFTPIYTLSDTDIASTWQKITIYLTPYADQTIYLAFQYQGNFTHAWGVDDVTVVEIYENDLSISAVYPFTQVPVSQSMLPALSANVRNVGLNPQTNIVVTVAYNGTVIGTSEPLPSLAFDTEETIQIPITGASDIVLGDNVLTFIVTQDQTDENPDNNTFIETFVGTETRYVVDDGTVWWNLGNNTPISLGNIFTITDETVINAVEARFSASMPTRYSISLYAMNGDALDETPIFTQGATKPTTAGWVYTAVPTTTLQPGNYFLCLNQLDNTSFALNADNNPNRVGYRLIVIDGVPTFTDINSGYSLNIGAPLVRMVVELPQNDIAITAAVNPIIPFTKIPELQAEGAIADRMPLLPPAFEVQVQNIGSATQTDIQFAVSLNGETIGVSETFAMMRAGQTMAFSVEM